MNWHALLAVDFDKWAAQTYRANFPGVTVLHAPISDVLDKLPSADILLGGPPCQPHSFAGKRGASNDKRDCGPDFVAAIAKVQPRMFLMENVEGLLSSENGRYAQRLMKSMEDVGYVVRVEVQDAVSFGVPQFRVRCWWWGIRADLYRDGIRHCWPKPTHAWPPPGPCMFGAALLPGVTVGEALGLTDCDLHRRLGQGLIDRHGERRDTPNTEPSPSGGAGWNRQMLIQSHADPAQTIHRPGPTVRSGGEGHDGCCLRLHLRRGRGESVERRDHPLTEPSPTIPSATGGTGGIFIIEKEESGEVRPMREGALKWKQTKDGLWMRRLTADECMRLQSAPDSFAWPEGISKTAMYRVCGNGWAAGHGAAFSEAFRAADPDARTVIDLFCGGGLGACGWHQRYWRYAHSESEAVA